MSSGAQEPLSPRGHTSIHPPACLPAVSAPAYLVLMRGHNEEVHAHIEGARRAPATWSRPAKVSAPTLITQPGIKCLHATHSHHYHLVPTWHPHTHRGPVRAVTGAINQRPRGSIARISGAVMAAPGGSQCVPLLHIPPSHHAWPPITTKWPAFVSAAFQDCISPPPPAVFLGVTQGILDPCEAPAHRQSYGCTGTQKVTTAG